MSASGGPDLVQNGLVLCLDAANKKSYSGSGTSWKDLSGNNKNFNWNSSPSFVSAGPLSYFSTVGNLGTGPASNSFNITDTSGYTVFLICMQNNLTTATSLRFVGSGAYNRAISCHLTWSDDVIYFDQGGCCDPDTRTNVASGGSQTWNIWALRRLTNSSTRTISKNGRTLTTNTATAASLNLISNGVEIANNWDARLNCIHVYNRDLSDLEILQNYNALKGRFLLT
jgi:hypothetical protein